MKDVPDDPAWHDPSLAARLSAMRFTKRRSEAELGRWTAKQALARALGVDTGDEAALRRIVIRNAADGAPEAFWDEEPVGMRIAMTDRADWAVCTVLSGSGDVGCDLELVEPRSAAFARDYLTSAEQSWLSAAPDRDEAANLIWSAKESALKVLRTGLRRDTRSVEVAIHPTGEEQWQPLTVRDLVSGCDFPGYWIRYGEFVLTVATRDATGRPVSFEDPPPLASARPSHAWMERPQGHGG